MNEAQTIAALSERLARRERELQAVHRISSALHEAKRLDEFLEQALRAAIETLEATAGAVLLHDAASNRLVYRYVQGLSANGAGTLCGRAISAEDGIAGRVFQSGEGLITPDPEVDFQPRDTAERAGHSPTRDAVTAPLKTTDGHCLGVMQVFNRRRGRFDRADLKTLEILCGHAATGIETARLNETIVNGEVDKRRFACEVLRCVTGDKLRLVEHAGIPSEGSLAARISLTEPRGYARMRSVLADAAGDMGMHPELVGDLVLAAGEAATNTIKHGVNGCVEIRCLPDRLAVDVRDEGPGIQPRDLPQVLFQAGFSTKVSLGMGYSLMLELADRIWLATGPEGTHIRLEKLTAPPKPSEEPLREVLDRFAKLDPELTLQ